MVSCCGLNKGLGTCGSSDGERVNIPLSSAWMDDALRMWGVFWLRGATTNWGHLYSLPYSLAAL